MATWQIEVHKSYVFYFPSFFFLKKRRKSQRLSSFSMEKGFDSHQVSIDTWCQVLRLDEIMSREKDDISLSFPV